MNANKLRTRLEAYLVAVASENSSLRDALQAAAQLETDSEFEQKLDALTPTEVAALMDYRGNWNAFTNTPTLANGTGDSGDVYRVSTAATRDLGSGSITFRVGDQVIYNGTTWELSESSSLLIDQVRYVNKSGNDTTGDGSLEKPFLTVGAAQTGITDASSSKPYIIFVGPGIFTESASFAFESFKFIRAWAHIASGAVVITRSDNTPIPMTGSVSVASTFNVYDVRINGGLAISQPSGATVAMNVNVFDSAIAGKLSATGAQNPAPRPTVRIFNSDLTGVTATTDLDGDTTIPFHGCAVEMYNCRLPTGVNRMRVTTTDCNGGVPTLTSQAFTGGTPALTYDFGAGGHTLVLNIDTVLYTYTSTLSGTGHTVATVVTDMNNGANWSPSKPVIASSATVPSALTTIVGSSQFSSTPQQLVKIVVDTAVVPVPIRMSVNTTGSTLKNSILKLTGRARSGYNDNASLLLFGCQHSGWWLKYLATMQIVGGSHISVGESQIEHYSPILKLNVPAVNATYNDFTFSSGASLANVFYENRAKFLGYDITIPGNWTTAPRTAGLALDELASRTKTLETNNTTDVTLGAANGLSLSAQVLSLGQASDSSAGALSYYKHAAEQDLGSLVWTAGVAPSGTINQKYRWTRIGNQVALWVKIDASVAGTAVSAVDFALPGDMPAPAVFASQPDSTVVAYGAGNLSTSGNSGLNGASASKLYKDALSAYRVTIETTVAVAGAFAWATVSYPAA